MDNNNDRISEEIKDPFEEKTKSKNPSRIELMKMTGAELAELASDKSTLLMSTLKRLKKAELCDIILDVKDDKKKSRARQTRIKSESEVMIDLTLDTLLKIKKSREGDKAAINPIAHELFKTTAVSKIDDARANNVLSNNKLNTAIFVASSAAIMVDTLIGFNNVPGLFKKIQDKIKKKKSDESDSK